MDTLLLVTMIARCLKTLYPKHDKDKGKALESGDGVNYTTAKYDYTIHNINEVDNYVNTFIINEKEPDCKVTTHKGTVTLKGPIAKPATPTSQYNLIEHLGKTPAQISILELLRLSPEHKAILDKALATTTVPIDLHVDQFQAMVGHITSAHTVTFTENDDSSLRQPYNATLHIDVLIHNIKIKRVLIDKGAGLNMCTQELITNLGFSENIVDPSKKITIKAYDEEERSSKGSVTLPIRIGPVVKDAVCQVVDLPLTYNILFGRPWIHEMQAVPSTYHQCIKFPHNGVEITIRGDPNPFMYCHNLSPKTEITIPSNREAFPSQSYVDLESLKASSSKSNTTEIKI